jgi:hypothetical protein
VQSGGFLTHAKGTNRDNPAYETLILSDMAVGDKHMKQKVSDQQI